MAKTPKILLTSEAFVKSNSNISDNTSTKFIVPAIRESQDTELREVIGTSLLNKLCDLVKSDEVDDPLNAPYKELLGKVQYFMLYVVLSKLCMLLNFKLDNIGVYSTNDDNAYSVKVEDTFTVQNYYINQADHYRLLLQQYLLKNRQYFPELTECDCYNIQSHLYSAASGGLWLGGARGKGRTRRPTFGYDKDL